MECLSQYGSSPNKKEIEEERGKFSEASLESATKTKTRLPKHCRRPTGDKIIHSQTITLNIQHSSSLCIYQNHRHPNQNQICTGLSTQRTAMNPDNEIIILDDSPKKANFRRRHPRTAGTAAAIDLTDTSATGYQVPSNAVALEPRFGIRGITGENNLHPQGSTSAVAVGRRRPISRSHQKKEIDRDVQVLDDDSGPSFNETTRQYAQQFFGDPAAATNPVALGRLKNDDSADYNHTTGRRKHRHSSHSSRQNGKRIKGEEITILDDDDDDDVKLPANEAIHNHAHVGIKNDDPEVKFQQVKISSKQAAIQQIQEIFPLMDPDHIIPKLTPPITPQSIQLLIEHFASEASYPKINIARSKKVEKTKQVDYDNEEYARSIMYKYQCNDRLLNVFPFMSKDGISKLLAHYNGRYYKTHMHIVDIMKKLKDGPNFSDIDRHDEFTRLNSGGRLKEHDREKFALQIKGIKFNTVLKHPKKNRGNVNITDTVLLDEIKYTKSKIREWSLSVQKERTRMAARKQAEEIGATIECTCCYGDFAMEEMVSCQEGHLFCMDCLRMYAQERVFGNNDLGKKGCIELCCMDMSGCESWFSREQLQKSLDKKVMKKYDELQTTLVLEKAGLEGLCKCPQCDFQASLPESEMIFQCPSCEFESCRKCGEESHIPLRCEEVEKKTETSARLQVEEAMSQARIRLCPKGCKQGFYKVSVDHTNEGPGKVSLRSM